MQKRLLYIAATVLAALVAAAAFVSPAGAWPLAALSLACVAAANLDKFQEISAGTSGLKAVLRDARTEVANLRDVVELMSEFQLIVMQQVGRWASDNDAEKAENLNRMLTLMRRAGIPDDRIKEIKKTAWDRFVVFDYVFAITGNSTVPDTKSRETEQRWRALRRFERPATPDELEAFLDEVGDKAEPRRHLLTCLRRYIETGEHPDQKAWRERNSIPRVFVENPPAQLAQ